MENRKRIMIMLFIIITIGLVFAGCNGTSALLGRWELEEGPTHGNPEEMELLKGGTGIVDDVSITWKTENGRFFITHPLFAFSASYKVSGSTLTFVTNDGDTLIYKKNKLKT